MKKAILLAAMAALLAEQSHSAVCKMDTWDVYQGLANCTIGNSTLSNFEYTNDTNTPYDPVKITAKPDPDQLGLDFALAEFTYGELNKARAIVIKFRITNPSGESPYTSETLDMSTRDIQSGAPLDVVALGAGVATIMGDEGLSLTHTEKDLSKLTDTKAFFPPQATVDVADTLRLAVGANVGGAQIKAYKVLFTQVPEPGSALLLAIGGLGLLGFRSKRVRSPEAA